MRKISIVLFFLFYTAALAVYLFYDMDNAPLSDPNLSPSFEHIFGTDSLGRDYFARVMLGTQISYLVGVLGSLVTVTMGALIGIFLAFSRQRDWFQRFIDIYQSLPSFALVTVYCLFFQNLFSSLDSLTRSILTLIIAVALSHWMNSARVLSSKILKTLGEPYIESSLALGAKKTHLIKYHLFPAFKEEYKTLFVSYFPQVVVYESFMSFVGLGIPSPFTSWGSLIQDAWTSLSVFPHLLFFPGLMLFTTLLILQFGLNPSTEQVFKNFSKTKK